MVQVYILLGISAILAGFLPALKKNSHIFAAIALQFGIMLLTGYPAGYYLGLKMTLLFLLILQCHIFLPSRYGVFLSLAMIALTLGVQTSATIWNDPLHVPGIEDKISFVFYTLFVTAVCGLLRHTMDSCQNQKARIDKLNNAVARLTSANMDFQEYASDADVKSRIKERKRISRDIHDTIGHSLMNMIMMMEAAKDIIPPDQGKLRDIITLTRNQAQKGLAETRRALQELRLMEEKNYSGLPAIQKLISIFERATGVRVICEYGNIPFYFSDEINIFLYRMVQEGLTNAFRHGNATAILIHFWITKEKSLTLRIRDNGKGADEEITEGIGLAGMRERLAKIHATLEARNVYNGFELVANIPLHSIQNHTEKTEEQHE
jgi:signal transduction histidine kinase